MWNVLLHRFAKRHYRTIYITGLEHLPWCKCIRTDDRHRQELYTPRPQQSDSNREATHNSHPSVPRNGLLSHPSLSQQTQTLPLGRDTPRHSPTWRAEHRIRRRGAPTIGGANSNPNRGGRSYLLVLWSAHHMARGLKTNNVLRR